MVGAMAVAFVVAVVVTMAVAFMIIDSSLV